MMPDPRKILVIAMPLAGDALLCTPLLTALRTNYPGAEIHVLLRRGFAGVLEGNSDVDRVIEATPRPPTDEIRKLFLENFRAYDLLLSNSTSDRMSTYGLMLGRYRVYVVPPRELGIPWKAWLHDLHTEVNIEKYHTLVQTNKLGELIGIEPGKTVVLPRSPASASVLEGLLGQGWKSQPYIVCHASASRLIKNWQADGWRLLTSHFADRGFRVVLTGGPGESECVYIDELGLDMTTACSLVGKLSLADVSMVLEHCSLFVGIDTLVSHMAAAAGAPAVVLFGPSNPDIWGPWPQKCHEPVSPYRREGSQRVGNVHVIRESTTADYVSSDEGIRNVSAEIVIQAADAMLRKTGVEPQ